MSEETWKDILANDEPKGFKPPRWWAVLVEVTIFLVVGIAAVILRYTDWAPLFQRPDLDRLCNEYSFNKEALENDSTHIFYSICIAAPLAMVIICEIERSYFSINPNYKVFNAVQRFMYISLRPIGMFIFGIFLISVITDYIKLQVTWPRPYFLKEHQQFCYNRTVWKGVLNMEERFGLTSFPCHLSSLSAFTTFLAASYAHNSTSLHLAPFIKPMVVCCLFLFTISGSIYRVNINYNHWIDAACGLLLGSSFAYTINLVLLQSYKYHYQAISECAWKLLLPRIALPNKQSNNGNTNYAAGTSIATIHTIRSHNSRRSRLDSL